MDASGMHYPHLVNTHFDGEISLLAACLMRGSFESHKITQSPIRIYLYLLLGSPFGLNPGSTPCAYYSLWIPISTLDIWSLCFPCLMINDYSRAPAEFPEEEGSELCGHQPIVGIGAVHLNSGEA